VSLLLFLFLAFSSSSYADSIVLRWEPSTTRENGTLIDGDTTFEVFHNSIKVYGGEDSEYKTTIEPGMPHYFEIYQLENGLSSKPLIKTYYIDQSPPNRPGNK